MFSKYHVRKFNQKNNKCRQMETNLIINNYFMNISRQLFMKDIIWGVSDMKISL